jgi:hypothetical protein
MGVYYALYRVGVVIVGFGADAVRVRAWFPVVFALALGVLWSGLALAAFLYQAAWFMA